jgi:PKD repeat protein
VNQAVAFTSRSTGNPTDLEWDFDGHGLRGETVSHAWTDPGTYTVRLKVSNSAGESEATATVVVDERVVAPVARSGGATTAEERQVIRFTSLSINNPIRLVGLRGRQHRLRKFGRAAFDVAGRYTVTLRAANAAGEGVATTTIIVVADVPAPIARSPPIPSRPSPPRRWCSSLISPPAAPDVVGMDFGDDTQGSAQRTRPRVHR